MHLHTNGKMDTEIKYHDPKYLYESNDKRIVGAGIKMWDFMRSLSKKEKISGLEALYIMNTYGLRPEDVVFLCSTHGCNVDLEGFRELLIYQR